MKEVYVLYTCDIWKTKDSMRTQGIFSSRRKLNKAIRYLIKENIIETVEFEKFSPDWTVSQINDHMHYCYIKILSLNELAVV